jgi:LuxR family maltose regulon positive regulatory protein
VIISAPAGYGKTSLLGEWAEHDERPFAWVMLDRGDNDPLRLLGRVAAALARSHAAPGRAANGHTGQDAHRDGLETPELLADAELLMQAVASERKGAVLVLDDAHVLHAPAALSVLKGLARAMPASGGQLVLASRTVPALALGRLRAARALLTLDARDLAMTPGEATGLLHTAGLEADRPMVEALRSRTEGWPAALYLAALSLRDQPDVGARAEQFAGNDHALSEYICEEVLAAGTPQDRDFLVRTAILDQLSGPLCDAALERSDSAVLISAAAARNLMLIPLDRTHASYRCHPMLRDVLRTELDRLQPGLAPELHRRASDWFRERGDVEKAVQHAVAAGDPSLAGELLWPSCASYLTAGHEALVARWLDAFAESQLAGNARLALCAAHTHLAMGDLGAAEHWTRTASTALRRPARGDAEASLRAGIGLVEAAGARHGISRMAEDAKKAWQLTDEASPWRAFCCLLLGVAHYLDGEPASARDAFEEGARLGGCVAPRMESLCFAQLALMAAEKNDWERASDLAASATGQVARCALDEHPTSALVFATSAWVCAHEGLAAEAKRDLRRSTNLLPRLGEFMPWYETQTRVAMARACLRLADVALARTLLSQASRHARRMPDVPILRTWLDEVWSEIDDLGASSLSGPCSLTMAELRILRFLPTHLSFREIGSRLHVSTNTVKSQAHAIYRKLGVASRSEAVAQASALGLIEVTMI